MTRTAVGPATVAALALLLLTGCVGATPSPTSTPKAEPTESAAPAPAPEPTPEPADPLATVTALVVRPQFVELRDDAGAVVASLDYLGEFDDAQNALVAVLGPAASTEEYPRNNHFPGGTIHSWQGLEVWQHAYEGDQVTAPRTYFMPTFTVHLSGPASGGIALATDDGPKVGDPWAELMADPELQTNPSGCSGPYVDSVDLPKTDVDGNPYDLRVSVEFAPSQDEATIAQVIAPVEVHEGCA